MDRTRYVSRRQASKLLGVTTASLGKIADAAGISRHRLPGHSREYLDFKAVLRLQKQFEQGGRA